MMVHPFKTFCERELRKSKEQNCVLRLIVGDCLLLGQSGKGPLGVEYD